MRAKAEKGRISIGQLFFILFTVRLYSLLISVQGLADYLIFLAFTAAFSCIAVLIKAKADYKPVRFIIGLLLIGLTVQTVASYIVFTDSEVHPDFSKALLVILISASSIYAVSLKLEPLARFSLFCGVVLALSVVTALLTNIKAFHISYLSAASFELKPDALSLIRCLDLPLIYLAVSDRVNGNPLKALLQSVTASYGIAAVVLLFIYCVTGTALKYYSYPAFTLFQLSRAGSFSRLDVAFTGSVLLALFLKSSVMLYSGLYLISGDKFEKN